MCRISKQNYDSYNIVRTVDIKYVDDQPDVGVCIVVYV